MVVNGRFGAKIETNGDVGGSETAPSSAQALATATTDQPEDTANSSAAEVWTGDPLYAPIVVPGVPSADELIATIRSYLPEANYEIIRRAYAFAARSHHGQMRKSGEPYFAHPVDVAFLITRLRLDSASICAGLLHDVVEDTTVSVAEIEQRFTPAIAAIVDGVTKLEKLKYSSREKQQAENYRKMLVAMSKDIRVLLIKLADRLHNMTTLQHMKPESQKRIAQETIEVYAPLANRLGIGWMKAQLEDLCFRHLLPEEYHRLADQVGQRQVERQAYVTEVVEELKTMLAGEGMETAYVYGRPKHLYGIWRKMEDGKLPYEQIYDAQGFRVIVNDVKECYAALGAVHTRFTPVPGRFKDYIALVKDNRYQSLHTTVVATKAERIEVQIRTHEMHRVAEEGVAAHWRYKERGESISVRDEQRFALLKSLTDWIVGVKDTDEMLDAMKIDQFSDQVYAFTPQGDVKRLPRGATPVDFAYTVHSKVGDHIVGAKIDGVMVSLKHHIRNGDMVEVLTRPDAHPSPDWLEFVITPRAKAKIRSHIHAEQRERALHVGTDLLEKALRKIKFSLQRAAQHEKFAKVLQHFKAASAEDLAVAVGYGKTAASDVAAFLVPEPTTEEQPIFDLPPEPKRGRKKTNSAAITVDGIDDVMIRFGRCCSPVPGDPIIGVVTRGRGVTVHTRGCHFVLDADPMRRLDCEWNNAAGTGSTVKLRIYTENATGLLAAMSARFMEAGINIQSAHCDVIEGRRAVNDFEVLVHNLQQLNDVIAKLSKLRGVTRVERVRT